MGTPNTVSPLLNGGSPYYLVNKSLRFRSSASAYLSRTPASAGSQTTWTWSGWVKRGALADSTLLGAASGSNATYIYFLSNSLVLQNNAAGVVNAQLITSAVYRDPSAWYHIVVVWNTSDSTSSNRLKIYVNGQQVTSFSATTYPSQNTISYANSNIGHYIGTGNGLFDGYMAEVNFIDGQALTPSSFGAFDTNGIWQPIRYSGTYGTNGFYLPFTNTASTATLGNDYSGNGNTWTVNNISLTAGTTYDSMIDSPTVSASSSNYAVLNPLIPANSGFTNTFADGNQNGTITGTGGSAIFSSITMSTGSWYWETYVVNVGAGTNIDIGICSTSYPPSTMSNANGAIGGKAGGYSIFDTSGVAYKANNNVATAYGVTFTNNDIIMCAFDATNGKLWFGKNGTWMASGDPATAANPTFSGIPSDTYWAGFGNAGGVSRTVQAIMNFGQRPFTYTPPTGYNALNTANLPPVTINYGAPYMNAITYTGYGPLVPSGLGQLTKRNAYNQNVSKSLRFRSSASAYMNRTPAAAGSLTTMTFSCWAKLATFNAGTNQWIWGAVDDNYGLVQSVTSNALSLYFSGTTYISTTSVFRDPSAWYHILAVINTTSATSTNRLRLYVNGVEQPIASSAYPTQNATGQLNNNVSHNIGRAANATRYWDGYLSEVYFIDGQALTPSSFGETNSDGVWMPKSYTGTYGTNGFYLPFTNTTSTTTLGNDSSGNGNNWTTNNFSLTAGATYDSMIDSPTDYASAGDYCVYNPLDVGTNITTSNANLSATASTSVNALIRCTTAISSGKWYWEVTATAGTSYWAASIVKVSSSLAYASLAAGDSYSYSNDGNKYNGQTATAYGNTYTTNDTVMVAFDATNGNIWFGKNGTWQGSGDPVAGTGAAYTGISGTYLPGALINSSTLAANFGQRPFSYTAPTGFNPVNTYNLPTPSNTWFASGNNSGRGSATAYPDFVWIKSRSSAQNHSLNDTVRGPTLNLITNNVNTEAGASTMFSVNKYGLTLGNDASVNSSSYTDVMWGWQAGQGTTSTNTSGTITSTTSVSANSGFSIVSYTGNFTAGATVGHGLGVAPSMILIKTRTQASVDWITYHTSLGATKGLYMDTGAATTSAIFWNNTTPTSSVITLGGGAQSNGNGQNMIAYCWAAVKGYSAFGSYTGNGSADGPFVYCGFRPRWVMIKSSSGIGVWNIIDTSRSSYNMLEANLEAQSSGAETGAGTQEIDILSNGFKYRGSSSNAAYDHNNSGVTYIYAAFAENPFNISRAR